MAYTAPPSWYLTQTYTQIKRRVQLDGDGQPVKDQYGNVSYVETQVSVPNCLWDPKPVTSIIYAGRLEITDREEHVSEFGEIMIADPNIDLEPEDAFIINGDTFEVLGPIERHTGSRMGNDYAMVPLIRVTG